ncbi:hypothetical protein CI105_03620 [Candidatus Izimaplasma bacterium ZiA1]|uniref:ABC transporter substrate-binding protein n=1 Tax=Candidatus Izimoplasma sp. ZiA1 TaxID=2024899 RepID=UPI000BAA59E6|nr:hypothetical protein CI105_03620 [Candidatus Izimaplasma bacterium ZiA1]
MKKLLILFLTAIASFSLAGCKKEKENILIGFSATLTGTYSEVGVSEMYGVEFAIHLINENGGVNGRQLELIVKDDLFDETTAIENDNELIDKGVVAIIGHSLSQLGVSTVQNINEKDKLMISPSIGTDALTGYNDYFFRVVPTAYDEGALITSMALSEAGSKALFIYDNDNFALTGNHKRAFDDYVNENFEYQPNSYGFDNGIDSADYDNIKTLVIDNNINTLVVAANSLNAGNLSFLLEQLTTNKLNIHFTSWASSQDLPTRISSIVHNYYSYSFFNQFDVSETFSGYNNLFFERYGRNLDMMSIFGIDTVNALYHALESSQSFDSNDLKQTLLGAFNYDSVQGSFSFDENGDVLRAIYQFEIIDNTYFLIDN